MLGSWNRLFLLPSDIQGRRAPFVGELDYLALCSFQGRPTLWHLLLWQEAWGARVLVRNRRQVVNGGVGSRAYEAEQHWQEHQPVEHTEHEHSEEDLEKANEDVRVRAGEQHKGQEGREGAVEDRRSHLG